MSRTVSMLTEEEIEAYRAALRDHAARKRRLDETRWRRAWDLARRAAILLREEFGVSRVVVFGSLVHPHLFHAHSDVDLATWGLSGRPYYRAVGVLQSLDPTISVDLIAFEEAPKRLQEIILREGEDL
ncbi:MAG: nucleotidyltransferase domain-containing protein [Anaerolineae bacterium]|nr:MAG: nucleotidyltransferase domain-containing protein [Anaerolineae bacterium]